MEVTIAKSYVVSDGLDNIEYDAQGQEVGRFEMDSATEYWGQPCITLVADGEIKLRIIDNVITTNNL